MLLCPFLAKSCFFILHSSLMLTSLTHGGHPEVYLDGCCCLHMESAESRCWGLEALEASCCLRQGSPGEHMNICLIDALHNGSTPILCDVNPAGIFRVRCIAWIQRPGTRVNDTQDTVPMAVTEMDAIPHISQEICSVHWQSLAQQPFRLKFTARKLLSNHMQGAISNIHMHQ